MYFKNMQSDNFRLYIVVTIFDNASQSSHYLLIVIVFYEDLSTL